MTPEWLICLLARLCLPVILGNHHPVAVSVGRVYEPHGFGWRVRRISATALETWKLLVASLHVDRTVEGDPTWGMSDGSVGSAHFHQSGRNIVLESNR